jgi:hypothetical protein
MLPIKDIQTQLDNGQLLVKLLLEVPSPAHHATLIPSTQLQPGKLVLELVPGKRDIITQQVVSRYTATFMGEAAHIEEVVIVDSNGKLLTSTLV